MIEAQPSKTALRVALRRAAHQVHDSKPLVFDDPLAVRILGPDYADEIKRTPDSLKRPFSAGLRAFMVARARLAEDTLAEAVHELGATQYLVLGAGLDTFACRNPYSHVRVFEIDHPATQAWKLDLLHAANITPPPGATFVAVDFEADSLRARLTAAGFDFAQPTVTAWLGVVPYLTAEAFRATMRVLSTFPAGSKVLFDYSQPRDVLSPVEQLMHDSLSARVAQAGEPFQLFFTPAQLAEELASLGMNVAEDLDSAALTARYFAHRTDGLHLRGKAGRMCIAATSGVTTRHSFASERKQDLLSASASNKATHVHHHAPKCETKQDDLRTSPTKASRTRPGDANHRHRRTPQVLPRPHPHPPERTGQSATEFQERPHRRD